MKYTIGRPRPHFLNVCRPKNDCKFEKNLYVNQKEIKCTGLGLLLDNSYIDQGRLKHSIVLPITVF